ncbi:hypothetical protein P171DRAFT_39888 [Karstenula rhodostoma CBS 690.94]|uniref:Uncharacterized protein n=1 Tax=Karstenula rhodostoma CBS 690.94 TaxID=1392251 RepID=A0A9P4PGL7_9PLEO|nr:hypothetical protein P171DRAFT_39888 [Karstenula rhodostoma CBS 690.94]
MRDVRYSQWLTWVVCSGRNLHCRGRSCIEWRHVLDRIRRAHGGRGNWIACITFNSISLDVQPPRICRINLPQHHPPSQAFGPSP